MSDIQDKKTAMRDALMALGEMDDCDLSSEGRVAAVEEACPRVRFSRNPDGSVVPHGGLPEQATGTIDKRPFFFRFRHDTARLAVFPPQAGGTPITPADVPSVDVPPVLVSRREGVTGDPFAGVLDDEEFVSLFLGLIGALHAP